MLNGIQRFIHIVYLSRSVQENKRSSQKLPHLVYTLQHTPWCTCGNLISKSRIKRVASTFHKTVTFSLFCYTKDFYAMHQQDGL